MGFFLNFLLFCIFQILLMAIFYDNQSNIDFYIATACLSLSITGIFYFGSYKELKSGNSSSLASLGVRFVFAAFSTSSSVIALAFSLNDASIKAYMMAAVAVILFLIQFIIINFLKNELS